MKEIPVKQLARQSLSVMLEQSLYQISLKECNGIMAATIIRDDVMIVENRRICAGMTIIPEGYLEEGNFVILTLNNEIPYYTGFESSDVLVYLTIDEVQELRSMVYAGPLPGSIPSGPLTDFNYMTGKLSDGLKLARASVGTYIHGSALNTAAINIARFESNGLLIEGAGTNLFKQSYASAWQTNGTITPTAPDAEGLLSYTCGANATGKFLAIDSLVVGKTYTLSMWASCVGSTYYFGLEGLPSSSLNSQIDSTFKKVSVTFVAAATTYAVCAYGNSGAVIKVGRCQVEEGNLSTSLIKTAGTTASRSADNLSLTQSGAKTTYREYIPLLTGQLVKEFVSADVALPACHLQRLLVWNRDLTDQEKANV